MKDMLVLQYWMIAETGQKDLEHTLASFNDLYIFFSFTLLGGIVA